MELWMTEHQTKNLGLSARVKKTLFTGQSDFQQVTIVDTDQFGRMLILDGVFQTLCTHPNPKNVLVIGGGDGGTIREVVKHNRVEKAEMVEIDGMVVEVSKKHLPEIAEALINGHPKVQLKIEDGIRHIQNSRSQYDVIIVDCSDPIGPGQGLFTHEFYESVHKALKEDGLFVQQTESPFYHQELVTHLFNDIGTLFPITRLYLAQIPLYPSGTHCFTIGSKKYDPWKADTGNLPDIGGLRYWNKDIQKSCFALPNFIQELLK